MRERRAKRAVAAELAAAPTSTRARGPTHDNKPHAADRLRHPAAADLYANPAHAPPPPSFT